MAGSLYMGPSWREPRDLNLRVGRGRFLGGSGAQAQSLSNWSWIERWRTESPTNPCPTMVHGSQKVSYNSYVYIGVPSGVIPTCPA